MRKALATAAFATLSICGTASMAHASGYFLYEESPRAVGQGEAVIADAAEASTLYYNTAGMARLEGVNLQLALNTIITPSPSHTSPTGRKETGDTQAFPIPTFFGTWKPNRWLAVGVGGYADYGLGIRWPDNWSGYGLVKNLTLKTYTIQPSVAVGPFEGFTIGAGVDILFGSVDITRGLGLGSGKFGTVRIDGNNVTAGFNAGVQYEPKPWLRLGATVRGPVKLSLSPGRADFTVPPAFDAQLRDQAVSTSLTTPTILGIGGRVRATEKLAVEADFMYLTWSNYSTLDFNFEDKSLNASQTKHWKDAFQIRTGGEYDLTDRLQVRAGLIFDRNPVPNQTLDPLSPDANRLDFSVGAGYAFNRWLKADLGYMYVYIFPRTVDATQNSFPGKYNIDAHVISLGATAKF